MNNQLNKVEVSINDRIKILISTLNLSARAFSHAIEVPESTTRNYLDKGTKPGTDYIERIATHFSNVNLAWLITGRGEPLIAEPDSVSEPTTIYTKKNIGNAIGTNRGIATQSQGQVPGADLMVQLEAAQQLILQLRSQLRDKEHIIELLQKSK